jgi:hypothetical protein
VTAPPAIDPPASAAGAASDAEVSPSGKKPKSPRASTTDPEARVVKMPDGGFRPAYNMQIASVAGGQVVVAVDVSTSSSDRGLARPMLEKIEATYGKLPKQHLVDGGFGKNDDIEWAHGAKVAIHCPPTANKHNTDPFAPREDDGPGVRAWRQRMQSEAGKATYRKRSIHECINARFRPWGLVQLTVRGRAKAAIVLTWYATTSSKAHGSDRRPQPPKPRPSWRLTPTSGFDIVAKVLFSAPQQLRGCRTKASAPEPHAPDDTGIAPLIDNPRKKSRTLRTRPAGSIPSGPI